MSENDSISEIEIDNNSTISIPESILMYNIDNNGDNNGDNNSDNNGDSIASSEFEVELESNDSSENDNNGDNNDNNDTNDTNGFGDNDTNDNNDNNSDNGDNDNISIFQKALVDSSKETNLLTAGLAGLTAAIGLATNNPSAIIGSMLMSPIGDIITQLAIIRALDSKSSELAQNSFQKEYFKSIGINIQKFDISADSIKFKHTQITIDGMFIYKNDSYYISNDIVYDHNGNISKIVMEIDATKYNDYLKFKEDDTQSKLNYETELKKISNWKFIPFAYNYFKSKIPEPQIVDRSGYRRFIYTLHNRENKNITKSIRILTIDQIRKDLMNYECISLESYFTFFANGKKYKFWDVAGWGVVMCLTTIIIGIFCGFTFGNLQNGHEKSLSILKERLSKAKTYETEDIKNEIDKLNDESKFFYFTLPTQEMASRTKLENSIGMIVIAICVGFILPNAIKYTNAVKIAGVGIAISLLPPLINFGMYLGLWILSKFDEDTTISLSENDILDAMFTSIVVFIINFAILFTITTFRLDV
jgi:hypothetical protein